MTNILIEKMAPGGDAIGRLSQAAGPTPPASGNSTPGPKPLALQVVFVPYGAPGDKAAVGPLETRKNFSRAWITEVLTPSPHRVMPPCPHFFKPGDSIEKVCGGCDWQHLSYDFQNACKQQLLIENFQRIGRIAKPPVEKTLAAPAPWRYRNKVQIPFAYVDGKLTGGFYAPGTHTVVPFGDCLVQSESSVVLFKTVLEWFGRHPPEDPHWLRHLLIRSNAQGKSLVAVITHAGRFPRAVEFTHFLTQKCPSVVSLFQNVNPKPGNVVLGPEWHHLDGKRFLMETLLGLTLRLSPGAFFQVHHAMAEKLYQTAVDMAAPSSTETALDLYCGVGALGQLLAQKARYVWGIEENPQAVRDAMESAFINGLKNIRFLAGKCEAQLARGRFHGGAGGSLAAVVVDPPRAGCAPQVLRAVMRLAPKRIVYVSCDPATLARDAKYLTTGGYLLRRSVPVDLFPQTSHIESVSLFTQSP